MTDINHRRKNRKPVNRRYSEWDYHNGYAYPRNKTHENTSQEFVYQRVGRTDYLDKSLHGWCAKLPSGCGSVGASIGNDFTNGHRGAAKAVRGAKKYVRTRVRRDAPRHIKQELENY